MEVTTLQAEVRKELGRNQVSRLRDLRRVPCVVYGAGGESESLSLAEIDVERELRHHHRVFRLEYAGKTDGVFLQDVQFDVLTDRALHLDFKRIDLDKPIEVEVEFAYVGHPKGASQGGTLTKDHNSLRFNSLPAAVPEHIEVAVKSLDIGDKILAKDLDLPAGVTLIEGTEDTVICHVAAPSGGGADEAPAEGEGEGGEPAPEGGDA